MKWVYSESPIFRESVSLPQTTSRNTAASGPSAWKTPMWVTSNNPAALRVARCSCRTEEYHSGISQPAKPLIFAPRARWFSYKGVRFKPSSSGSTQLNSGRAGRSAFSGMPTKYGLRKSTRSFSGLTQTGSARRIETGPGILWVRSGS